MKKIIVTLCSLALSLAGSFGINQLASNNEAILDRNTQQVNIEQDAEAATQTTYTNEDNIEVLNETEDKVSEAEVATPKAEDNNVYTDNTKEEKEVKKAIVTKEEKKTTVAKKDSKKSSNKKTDSTSAKEENTNNNKANNSYVKPVLNNNTNNAANKASDYINNIKSNGNNVYVYKNVDLSNCNSTQDVVKELQKNGFQNINMNNIQNISSLQDILSKIGNQKTQGNNYSATPTPTTAPTKPAPTTKPTKPAPTTTPTKPAPTTTPSKPAPTTPPTNNTGSNQGFAEEVLRLVNIERSKAGLSPLTTNATLKAAADKRAQETKTSFSHTRPNGSKFSTVLKEYGISYRTAGENIAYGQRSPQEVVNGWMNSPGHRANILNGSFGKIGIGVYQSGGVIYWSQLFTN